MECHFCGQEFDSERGLHIHQSKSHADVDSGVRKFLDRDPGRVKEDFEGSDYSAGDLLDAEIRLKGREELLDFFKEERNTDFSLDKVDEKLEILDDIEKRLEDSINEEKPRQDRKDEIEKLRAKKKAVKRQVDLQRDRRKEGQEKIKALKERKREVKNDTEELSSEIESLTDERSEVTSKIKELKEKRGKMARKIDAIDENMDQYLEE